MLNAHRMGGSICHPCTTTKLNNTMKNTNKITRILAALSYLIEKQGLSPDQINELILTTIEEE